MSDILKEITQKLYEGEEKEVSRLVQEGLSQGLSPSLLLEEGLIAGMDKVGKDFKSGELFVPEVSDRSTVHAGRDEYPETDAGGE